MWIKDNTQLGQFQFSLLFRIGFSCTNSYQRGQTHINGTNSMRLSGSTTTVNRGLNGTIVRQSYSHLTMYVSYMYILGTFKTQLYNEHKGTKQ